MPPGLSDKLESAFSSAFRLVFEKGTGVIEKTYKKDELEKTYKVNSYAAKVRLTRKSLKVFRKKAASSGNKNLILSGVEGVGLGALGIGLPDIPLFVGMIFKSMYELALHYGIGYEKEEEKYFILLLIRNSLSYGAELERGEEEVRAFLEEERLPQDYDRGMEITRTAGALSGELLYMKFLQGLPVVGMAGGIYDAIYLKEILAYAKIKYHKRFLLRCSRDKAILKERE